MSQQTEVHKKIQKVLDREQRQFALRNLCAYYKTSESGLTLLGVKTTDENGHYGSYGHYTVFISNLVGEVSEGFWREVQALQEEGRIEGFTILLEEGFNPKVLEQVSLVMNMSAGFSIGASLEYARRYKNTNEILVMCNRVFVQSKEDFDRCVTMPCVVCPVELLEDKSGVVSDIGYTTAEDFEVLCERSNVLKKYLFRASMVEAIHDIYNGLGYAVSEVETQEIHKVLDKVSNEYLNKIDDTRVNLIDATLYLLEVVLDCKQDNFKHIVHRVREAHELEQTNNDPNQDVDYMIKDSGGTSKKIGVSFNLNQSNGLDVSVTKNEMSLERLSVFKLFELKVDKLNPLRIPHAGFCGTYYIEEMLSDIGVNPGDVEVYKLLKLMAAVKSDSTRFMRRGSEYNLKGYYLFEPIERMSDRLEQHTIQWRDKLKAYLTTPVTEEDYEKEYSLGVALPIGVITDKATANQFIKDAVLADDLAEMRVNNETNLYNLSTTMRTFSTMLHKHKVMLDTLSVERLAHSVLYLKNSHKKDEWRTELRDIGFDENKVLWQWFLASADLFCTNTDIYRVYRGLLDKAVNPHYSGQELGETELKLKHVGLRCIINVAFDYDALSHREDVWHKPTLIDNISYMVENTEVTAHDGRVQVVGYDVVQWLMEYMYQIEKRGLLHNDTFIPREQLDRYRVVK